MSFDINYSKSPHEVEATSSNFVVTGATSSNNDYTPDTGKLFHVPLPNEEQTAAMMGGMKWFKTAEDELCPNPSEIPVETASSYIHETHDHDSDDGMSVHLSVDEDGEFVSYTVRNVKTVEEVLTILEMMKRIVSD